MTPAQIIAAIAANTALQALIDGQGYKNDSDGNPTVPWPGNFGAVAEALSEGRTRASSVEIGNGMVLSTLGKDLGNVVLDLVQTSEDMRHVRPLLETGRLVVSDPEAAAWIAGLVVGGVLTQAQADALTALGQEPDPVDPVAVLAAWRAEHAAE